MELRHLSPLQSGIILSHNSYPLFTETVSLDVRRCIGRYDSNFTVSRGPLTLVQRVSCTVHIYDGDAGSVSLLLAAARTTFNRHVNCTSKFCWIECLCEPTGSDYGQWSDESSFHCFSITADWKIVAGSCRSRTRYKFRLNTTILSSFKIHLRQHVSGLQSHHQAF